MKLSALLVTLSFIAAFAQEAAESAEQQPGGGITGWIDEIRISKGVLPTDAFLRRQTLGLVIIFK